MFFASRSLKRSVEVLLDRCSPTSYHYATSKVGDLCPFNCAQSPTPVKRPLSITFALDKAHTKSANTSHIPVSHNELDFCSVLQDTDTRLVLVLAVECGP